MFAEDDTDRSDTNYPQFGSHRQEVEDDQCISCMLRLVSNKVIFDMMLIAIISSVLLTRYSL